MPFASLRALAALIAATTLFAAAPAYAQYTPSAGKNAPTVRAEEAVRDDEGRVVGHRIVEQAAPRDQYGNAQGNQHDLAIDGAFDGQTIAVLHFYTQEDFDFHLPKAALKEKGFSVYRWVNEAPSPKELAAGLEKANQLWIISDERRHLTPQHVAVIKRFFDAGHGVYIWGDNEPFYTDANVVAQALLGSSMSGNLPGTVTVGLQPRDPAAKKVGVARNHLLTTGLEYLFEGVTIATIKPGPGVKPLVYGSAGNLVTAYYDQDGKRAVLDGGFTRMYISWDTAGTGRYVKNAAAWLANVERFGASVAKVTTPQQQPRQKPLD
jgi:hypothetical protein